MNSINIFLLISFLSLLHCNEKNVHFINKLRTTWTAKHNPRDIRTLLGAHLGLPPNKTFKRKTFAKRQELPESYDLREAFPNCETIHEIRDQSKCGSCWAFGGSEAMSDRLCIHSGGKLQTRVSALHLITCCSECGNGCFGGWPIETFEYWQVYGIPSGGLYGTTDSCKPYFLEPCDDHMHKCHDYQDAPECTDKCIDEYPISMNDDLSFGVSTYYVSGEEDIMQEIYENGSVEGAFSVYDDFSDYDKGIYQHVTGAFLGGHAIKIIGWGVENDVKYWIIANSWNESWGENGYFRILKGVNECGIEDYVAAGMPKLEGKIYKE